MSRTYARLLVIAFCVLLAVPGATLLIERQPQLLPKVAVVECPPFQASLAWLEAAEKYFVANFGLKRRLVQLHHLLGYQVVGDLQSNSVLVGKDGWLYLKQSFGWKAFRSEAPMTDAERSAWDATLQRARGELERRKIPILYVITPSKETIHPEHLPLGATPARSMSRADEMLPLLRAAGITYLDLRAPLREAKSAGPLYDALDTHWNGRGADVAARLILERVGSQLALPSEYAAPSWHLSARRSPNDLGSMLALEGYLTEDSNELLPDVVRARRLEPPPSVRIKATDRTQRLVFEVADPALPKALILRDSFGTMLYPPLAEKFRRSVWLWTRDMDLRLVDKEKPDIVIYEITERLFCDDAPKVLLPRKKKGR